MVQVVCSDLIVLSFTFVSPANPILQEKCWPVNIKYQHSILFEKDAESNKLK